MLRRRREQRRCCRALQKPCTERPHAGGVQECKQERRPPREIDRPTLHHPLSLCGCTGCGVSASSSTSPVTSRVTIKVGFSCGDCSDGAVISSCCKRTKCASRSSRDSSSPS